MELQWAGISGCFAYFFVMFLCLGHMAQVCQNALLDISCSCDCLEYGAQYQTISLPPEMVQFSFQDFPLGAAGFSNHSKSNNFVGFSMYVPSYHLMTIVFGWLCSFSLLLESMPSPMTVISN